jgi:Cu(I)/Ag(I) efflux system membrane fusion protein
MKTLMPVLVASALCLVVVSSFNFSAEVLAAEPKITAHAGHDHAASAVSPVNDGALITSADPVVKYVCPMHPQIVKDHPDNCPICGMKLEPVQVGGQQETTVSVAGGMQQALGLRTEEVNEDDTLWRYVRALGTVQYDENAIRHIHPRMTGWVESVNVKSEGEYVRKGQKLFEIYSPELVNAQDDYLLARSVIGNDKTGKDLLHRAQLRLELLGLSAQTIKQLDKRGKSLYRVPFFAPYEGVVSKLELREGMYIQPGTPLLELVDLSKVWVLADVFENEQSWLEVGRPAEVTAAAQGLFDVEGELDYIYPELDPVTRAMRVRVVLENRDLKLRPGTLVDVELFGGPKRGLLTIPTEALILTGRENRVVVQRGDQSFASIPIRVGMISQGRAEILQGLQAGDRVVVSGQFLLDSEASIQGSLQRLSGSNTNSAAESHAHHNH